MNDYNIEFIQENDSNRLYEKNIGILRNYPCICPLSYEENDIVNNLMEKAFQKTSLSKITTKDEKIIFYNNFIQEIKNHSNYYISIKYLTNFITNKSNQINHIFFTETNQPLFSAQYQLEIPLYVLKFPIEIIPNYCIYIKKILHEEENIVDLLSCNFEYLMDLNYCYETTDYRPKNNLKLKDEYYNRQYSNEIDKIFLIKYFSKLDYSNKEKLLSMIEKYENSNRSN